VCLCGPEAPAGFSRPFLGPSELVYMCRFPTRECFRGPGFRGSPGTVPAWSCVSGTWFSLKMSGVVWAQDWVPGSGRVYSVCRFHTRSGECSRVPGFLNPGKSGNGHLAEIILLRNIFTCFLI
jgi:hypothetical protein